MPKNKCGECGYFDIVLPSFRGYCKYPTHSCFINRSGVACIRFKGSLKTYISEKEWINQWEEKDG